MGLQEAINNIWTSDYVQKNTNKSYKAAYNAEYNQVAAYLNGGAEPNWSGFSKMGKGLCEAEKHRRGEIVIPPVPPDPPPSGVTYPASYYTGPLGAKNPLPTKPGAFLIGFNGGYGVDWTQTQALINKREADMGRKYDCLHFHWGGEVADVNFRISQNQIQWAYDRGAIPIVSFSPNLSLAQIAAGQGDALYNTVADYFKSKSYTIMWRMLWEFNIGFAWKGTGQPFIDAWRHVVNLFKSRGANNVGFWWCPQEMSRTTPESQALDASYPGDTYVDWAGSDIYNWCKTTDGGCYSTPRHAGWAEFWEIQDYTGPGADGVNRETNHNYYGPKKPWIVGETGCVFDPAQPTKKGAWFRDIPRAAKQMEYLRGISFYDYDVSGAGDLNWQVDHATTVPEVYAGWKALAADPWFNAK